MAGAFGQKVVPLLAEGVRDHRDQALAGHNLRLTIDQGIQYVAERELAAAAVREDARIGPMAHGLRRAS